MKKGKRKEKITKSNILATSGKDSHCLKKPVDAITMQKLHSLQQKITPNFIDYCNTNNINLHQWYRWQLHLIWQQRKDHRSTERIQLLKK